MKHAKAYDNELETQKPKPTPAHAFGQGLFFTCEMKDSVTRYLLNYLRYLE